MLFRIIAKSISRRKSRVAIAIVAVILGAAVVGALVTTSLDVRDKVGLEFRQYGANILLIPESESISVSIGDIEFGDVTDQQYIDETDLPKIYDISWSANILGYSPYLYSIVEVGGQKVVMTGVWFDAVRKISPWWEITGMWIEDRNNTDDALVGASAAESLGLEIGDTFQTTFNDTKNETVKIFTMVGTVNTGDSEDYQIFVGLDAAQEMTGRDEKVSTVQVSALCTGCPVEDIAAEIENEITYVEAKSVKQMANAEMEILDKVEEMMFLVTGVALIASAMGVTTTMTASVVERQKEIGMMKAIGAENRRIASLFFSEAVIIGVVGGILGFISGIFLAQFIGTSVFGSPIAPNPWVLFVVLAISVGVSLLASAIPVRRAIKIEPARVLRGD